MKKEYKIATIGSEALAIGMKMAGVVESNVVDHPADAEALVKKLLERDDIGIIVIASRLVKGVKDRKLHDIITTSTMPLFLQVADYNEQMLSEDDELRALIIRALGIDMKNV